MLLAGQVLSPPEGPRDSTSALKAGGNERSTLRLNRLVVWTVLPAAAGAADPATTSCIAADPTPPCGPCWPWAPVPFKPNERQAFHSVRFLIVQAELVVLHAQNYGVPEQPERLQ